jgi:uncharacterized DUF497 family protein
MLSISFEWDPRKDRSNRAKHGVSFAEAQGAFLDKRRILAEDLQHSTAKETRYFCFGEHGGGITTVRFTYRDGVIRIFGAGYWTKGKRIYEQANQIHKGPRRGHKDR